VIDWGKLNKEEMLIISKIADRYIKMFSVFSRANKADKQEVEMDISACHITDCKLDLQKLLEADDYNFAHDVVGIRTNLDRDTRKLLNCFLPRCTATTERKII
jgi:hypothetical protein